MVSGYLFTFFIYIFCWLKIYLLISNWNLLDVQKVKKTIDWKNTKANENHTNKYN